MILNQLNLICYGDGIYEERERRVIKMIFKILDYTTEIWNIICEKEKILEENQSIKQTLQVMIW